MPENYKFQTTSKGRRSDLIYLISYEFSGSGLPDRLTRQKAGFVPQRPDETHLKQQGKITGN